MTFAPLTLKPEQKRRIACCQAGIAVAVLKLGTRRTLVSAQIFPQCRVLGITEFKASAVQHVPTRIDQLADLYITLAGRAAEEVVFETKSALSGSDLDRARAMVSALVTRYGVTDPKEKILTDAYDVAKKFAESHQATIIKVADALVERGELTAAEIEQIVAAAGTAPAKSC